MTPPRYDWHRDARSSEEPELRFEPHFQNDGLPVPPDRHILVAVSGGGDSMALLHCLADWRARSGCRLTVATVDHGLRDGSAEDALFVTNICLPLGLPHRTLVWRHKPTGTRSSASARMARYALLHAHARDVGATCIALGHTRDDQAETVTMRAGRLGHATGGTSGFAGMAARTGLVIEGHRIDLFRPLLHISRQRLRDHLTKHALPWRDDPTNDDLAYERVRIRQGLAACKDPAARARFASLCGRSRSWCAAQVAAYLRANGSQSAGILRLAQPGSVPAIILAGAIAAAVRRIGANAYPIPVSKLDPILNAVHRGKPTRYAVGRCLLTFDKECITVQTECRPGRTDEPGSVHYISSFDAPIHRALDLIATAETLDAGSSA